MSCQSCCAFDVPQIADFAAGGYYVYPTQDYSFVITTCPVGFICPPGIFPQTVTIPKNKVPAVPVPPNPSLLTLQGCQSLLSATVPVGASATVIAGIAAGLQQQWAQQQANCNLTTNFQIPKAPPVNLLPTIALNSACPNVSFSQTLPGFSGIDVTKPIAISGGTLPAGLSITQATSSAFALLSGTPTAPGSYSFTLQGTDTLGRALQQPYTMQIVGISNIGSVPNATENTAYSFQLTGVGGMAPYTFAQVSGSLPGITISASGLMTGTPNYVTAGSYPFSVTITDFTGDSCTQSGTLIVKLRPGPDWTQLAWSQYVFNQSGSSTVTGVALKNITSGQLNRVGADNCSISPVAAAGVTYAGGQVTSRIILTVSTNGGCGALNPKAVFAARVFQDGVQIGGDPAASCVDGSQVSGVYTVDFIVSATAGSNFTIDDASPGNKWAQLFNTVPGNLSFTWAIVNV